ncbi:MAG: twin-arginine translocase subunit TatC [Phycisphaerales bacterium]
MTAPPHTPSVMSLGDHLDELRRRLLFALAAPVPLMFVVFFASDALLGLILRPVYAAMSAADVPMRVQTLSPPEMIVVKLKLSIILALVLSAPWVLYQLWMFIAPGLYRHERRFVHLLIPGSAVLTLSGVLLLYYVMLPLMLQVLVLFAAGFEVEVGDRFDPAVDTIVSQLDELPARANAPDEPVAGTAWLLVPENHLYVAREIDGVVEVERVLPSGSGIIEQPYRLREVVNFVLLMLTAIVIAFQLPLVMMLLGWLDLARVEWLASNRKYALFACGAASAILTPQDIISMVLMMVPLYGLFELGLLLMRFLPAARVAGERETGERGQGAKRGRRGPDDDSGDDPGDDPPPARPGGGPALGPGSGTGGGGAAALPPGSSPSSGATGDVDQAAPWPQPASGTQPRTPGGDAGVDPGIDPAAGDEWPANDRAERSGDEG